MRMATVIVGALVAGAAFTAGTALSQEKKEGAAVEGGKKETFRGADPREHDPAEMNRRMMESMTANRYHAKLERLLGEWDLEMRMWMAPGGQPMVSRGTATWAWLYEGKWMQGDVDVAMMGMPVKSRTILGYDNFKKKYVSMQVNSMETALRTAEGNHGKDDSALYLYGAVDEYMTGEHDKTAALVFRFDGPDRFVMEIHDLSIGLENAKVMEFAYTRKR